MENCACLRNIIDIIIKIQKQTGPDCTANTCDRPYLGCNATDCCCNTRPVTFYSCPNGTLWTMPYTLNDTTGTSTVFRIESADGCCATARVLAPNPDETSIYPYLATESFFTINLNCVGAIKCLPDTYVSCI